MIGEMIGFVLQNLPAILLVLALALAARHWNSAPAAERFLAWILLLPIGVTLLWAAIYHVFFPALAASYIGWQVSPFQFEVGMADFALGVTAVWAFWGDLSFKTAAVCATSLALLGDAVGHLRQMVIAGNFAAGNAGVVFYMDILCPLLAIVLLVAALRSGPAEL